MSQIKATVLSICISLILIGFILKLSPSGKGQRAIKGILSLIMILIIVAPITGAISIESPKINVSEYSDTPDYSSLIENTTVNLLKSRIEAAIAANNLPYNFVDITVLQNGDNTRISAITVYIDNAKDIPNIKEAVRNELQLDVTVAVEQ